MELTILQNLLYIGADVLAEALEVNFPDSAAASAVLVAIHVD